MTSNGSAHHVCLTGASTVEPRPSAQQTGIGWFLRLRWVSLGIPLVIGGFLYRATGEIPWLLGAVVALTAVSNGAVRVFHHRNPAGVSRPLLAVLLVADTALLTVALLMAGGPSNPFSAFYIVEVALGALLLEGWWVGALALVTSLAFGSMYIFTSVESMHVLHHGEGFLLHLRGMWLSYTLVAFVVGFFVSRIVRTLQERERQIAELQRASARAETLASLSTLAAGAAHELGTPLGTIAVIAGEMLREAPSLGRERIREDAALLRAEAERCRAILEKMAAQAGANVFEKFEPFSPAELAEKVKIELGPERAKLVRFFLSPTNHSIGLPKDSVAQALTNLVRNGLDAAGPEGAVSVAITLANDTLTMRVQDEGPGMDSAILARLAEPFFTTKGPGAGMGLGLFLVRTLAERLGGRLDIASLPGAGTAVSFELPRVAP